jgi:hypothetical protein
MYIADFAQHRFGWTAVQVFVGAMDSMRALNARVGACRLLLDQHQQGSATHTSLSSLQSAAICEMIASTVMTADIRSEVGSHVVQVKWGSPNDCSAILAALAGGNASLLQAGKRRRSQQDFCNIVHYGTAMLWEQLASEVPSSSKLTLLLELLISLGCRCPSEHSVKLLCSVWLLVSEPAEELLKMTLDQKKVMLCHVKHSFESVRKASVDPPQWITALPTPLIFLRDYEGMYHAAFSGGQVPGPAGIDLKALTMLDLSYSCRGGARSVVPMGGMPSSSSSSSSAGSFQVALCDSPLERMANTFMSRIESMASAQQRMMEMMLGGTARSSVTSGPRSLLALANHDTASAVRRVPSFAFNSPQMALPDRVVDDVGVALAAASPAAPVAQLAQQPAPLAVVAVQAAEAPPARVSAAGNVEDMLNMLSDREDGKKKSKAAAKALALADDAAAPIADAKAKAAATPPSAKAKALAKTKAMADAKAKAMADAEAGLKAPQPAEAKADAKAKAKVIAKSGAPPPVNAKAKAAAKAKAKAIAKSGVKAPPPAKAGGMVLGCSKCRHRPGGCARCRNPEFDGFRYSV